jgi:hypothetical protein
MERPELDSAPRFAAFLGFPFLVLGAALAAFAIAFLLRVKDPLYTLSISAQAIDMSQK